MNAKSYTPIEGSPAWKILEFFRTNPDEKLDADLVAAKCDCDRRSVHSLLGPAVQAGLLKREEDIPSGELMYSLPEGGTKATGFHGWLERKGQASAEGRAAPTKRTAPTAAPEPAATAKARSAPFQADISAIKLDKGVPLPGRGIKPMDWTPLLARMEVGDSFALPANAKSAIGTAMKAFKDATGKELTSRRVGDGIRVWRVS